MELTSPDTSGGCLHALPHAIPRGCAGISMAYLEAGLVVASTLWYFAFEIAPGPARAADDGKSSNRIGRQWEKEFQP